MKIIRGKKSYLSLPISKMWISPDFFPIQGLRFYPGLQDLWRNQLELNGQWPSRLDILGLHHLDPLWDWQLKIQDKIKEKCKLVMVRENLDFVIKNLSRGVFSCIPITKLITNYFNHQYNWHFFKHKIPLFYSL